MGRRRSLGLVLAWLLAVSTMVVSSSGDAPAVAQSGCTIEGTNGDDVLVGTPGDDHICGGNGNDVINGGGGNDIIEGENGADQLFGDAGDDVLVGGNGEDLLDGGDGADSLDGGRGDDELQGSAGDDDLIGDKGDDLLVGGAGTDSADGGSGLDVCSAETEVACEADPADTSPPVVSLVSPVDGQVVFGVDQPVSVDASDDSFETVFVEVLVDGAVVSTATDFDPVSGLYESTIDVSALVEGEHEVVARATDDAGNSAVTDPVSVTVANDVTGVDALEVDYAAGLLTVDEYALAAMRSLAESPGNPRYALPPAVPEVDDEDIATTEWIRILHPILDDLQPETQDAIAQFLSPVHITVDLSADASGLSFPLLASTYVNVFGFFQATQTWPDCSEQATIVETTTMLGNAFLCSHTVTTPAGTVMEVYYNVEGAYDGGFLGDLADLLPSFLEPVAFGEAVAAIDVNPDNDIPDAIDEIIASLSQADVVYRGELGYPLTNDSSDPVVVAVRDGRGLVAWNPFGPETVGVPHDDNLSWIPRHELFHRYQFEFIEPSLDQVGDDLLTLLWFTEATAEWATHQVELDYSCDDVVPPTCSSVHIPGLAAGVAEASQYDNRLDEYLSRPDSLTRFSNGERPQYGAFIFFEYLDEAYESQDVVKEFWEQVQFSGGNPLDAISAHVAATDLPGTSQTASWQQLMDGYVRAAYELDEADPGIFDDSATSVWLSQLGNGSATSQPPRNRPAHETIDVSTTSSLSVSVDVSFGGLAYVEVVPPQAVGRVEVSAGDADGFELGVQLWGFEQFDSSGVVSCGVDEFVTDSVLAVVDGTCELFTVAFAHGDLALRDNRVTDSVEIVWHPNEAPVVDLGPNLKVLPGVPVDLQPTASDPDGLPDPLSGLWTVVTAPSGGTVTFGDDHSIATTAEFSTPGLYELKLTVSDGNLIGEDTLLVDVLDLALTQLPSTSTPLGFDTGGVVTVSGDGTAASVDGPLGTAQFAGPSDVVSVGGVAFVVEQQAIRVVDVSADSVTTMYSIAGSSTCTLGGATSDGSDLFVAQTCGNSVSSTSTILRFDVAGGSPVSFFERSPGLTNGYRDVTVGGDGRLYAGTGDGQVVRFDVDAAGVVSEVVVVNAGSGTAIGAITANPTRVFYAVDASVDGLWVMDVVGSDGLPIGSPTPELVVQGTVGLYPFALEAAGDELYGVVDLRAVRRWDTADLGAISYRNVAGGDTTGDVADGVGAGAAFGLVTGLGSDGTGLWVADQAGNRVRLVSATATPVVGQLPSVASGVDLNPGEVSTPVFVDDVAAPINFAGVGDVVDLGAELLVVDAKVVWSIDPATGVGSIFVGDAGATCTYGAAAHDGTFLYLTHGCSTSGRLLRVAANGVVSEVFDTGTSNTPMDVTVGPDGYLYVGTGSSEVLRVDANTGDVVSSVTIGGSFDDVEAITSDDTTVWFAVDGLDRIYRVHVKVDGDGDPDPNGTPVVALNPEVFVEGVSAVTALEVSGTNLYGLDGFRRVRRWDTTTAGEFIDVAGSGEGAADGTGALAQFATIEGIGIGAPSNPVASDGLWVADDNLIRLVVPGVPLPVEQRPAVNDDLAIADGNVTTVAGDGSNQVADGTGTAASFIAPTDVVATDTDVWVADGQAIRHIDPTSLAVTTLPATGYSCSIGGIDHDSTFLYAACGTVLFRFAPDGAMSIVAQNSGGYSDITVGPDGWLYAGTLSGDLLRIDPVTGQETPIDQPGSSDVESVVADATRVWFAVENPDQVRYITVMKLQDPADPTSDLVPVDPLAPSVLFATGAEVFVLESAGQYLYGQVGLHTVHRWDKSDGTTSVLVAGDPASGYADGVGAAALFDQIYGVSTDGTSLWVADQANDRIRKIDP